jgi:hypothetical protein
VSLQEKDLAQLQQIASSMGVAFQVIGSVGGSRLAIQPLLQLPVDELYSIWSSALADRLH